MRPIPQTSVLPLQGHPPAPHAANGSAGEIGGAVAQPVRGVRRDFTYVPQFLPNLTTNGQTGIPRG